MESHGFVYVFDTIAESAIPLLTAMALMVAVAEIEIAELYVDDAVVGVEPSVV